MRKPSFFVRGGGAALLLAAMLAVVLVGQRGQTPSVEAAVAGGTPATQNVAPFATGIVVSIQGTTVPATTAFSHFTIFYDKTILTATGATCGAATAGTSISPVTVDESGATGLVDFGCFKAPAAVIYGAGGTLIVATVTFDSDGPGGTSSQTMAAYQFTTTVNACIEGHDDSVCTATAAAEALGTITVDIPPGATNTFTPTNTPTATPTRTPTPTSTPCTGPCATNTPIVVGAAKTATPTGTRTVVATSTAAAVPTGSAPVATATKPGGGAGAGVVGPDTGTGDGGGGGTMLLVTVIAAVAAAGVFLTSGGWYWLRIRPRR